MDLRPCSRCGGALTGAFRFCPGCGAPVDEELVDLEPPPEPPGRQPRTPRARPPRPRPQVRLRRRRSPAARVRALGRRAAARASTLAARLALSLEAAGRATGRLAGVWRDAARLCAEAVLAICSSAAEAARLQLLLFRLHARRARVIYSTGTAVLEAGDVQVDAARAELRLLDELIGRALAHRATPPPPAAPRLAADPADAPTEESVFASRLVRA